MMLVPTYIRPSKINGLGLFAASKILKDTVIWQFSAPIDKKITGSICKCAKDYQEFVEKFGFKPLNEDYIILCGDEAIFINHSNTPNCGKKDSEELSIALRDIQVGEELTEDYTKFDTNLCSKFLKDE